LISETIIRNFIVPLIQVLVILGLASGAVAYMTLLERKILAFMQLRLSPRRVGPHGLLQPIADGIKLLLKEDITPAKADRILFTLAPIITVIPAFTALAVIPFSGGGTFQIFGYQVTPWIADVNVGLVFLLAISSLGIYGIMLGGWASNSKYPMLGALRSAAQMVSYEVPFGFSIIGVMMLSGTASMVGIVQAQKEAHVWYFLPQIFGLFVFFISGVAETNRLPFDLPEAEAELVAGFHTEYTDEIRPVHARRVHLHDRRGLHRDDPVLRRVAEAVPERGSSGIFELRSGSNPSGPPGLFLVSPEDVPGPVRLSLA
jgi:NADH-quinone oxidoreductase subunit H